MFRRSIEMGVYASSEISHVSCTRYPAASTPGHANVVAREYPLCRELVISTVCWKFNGDKNPQASVLVSVHRLKRHGAGTRVGGSLEKATEFTEQLLPRYYSPAGFRSPIFSTFTV